MFSQLALPYTRSKPFENLTAGEKALRVSALVVDILTFPIVAVVCGIIGSIMFILKTIYAIVKELLHRINCTSNCHKERLYNRIWGRVGFDHFVPSFILMIPIIGIALYWLIRRDSIPVNAAKEVHGVDRSLIYMVLPMRESLAAFEEKAPQTCLGKVAI